MSIGIIGIGYVGTALKEGFKDCYKIETYDIKTSLSSCNSINTLVSKSKIIFFILLHKISININISNIFN